MVHKTDNNATPEQAKTLGRRDLLKALAATGGAVTAATLLPGKWSKPVVEAGVMPAHAATSGALRINSLSVGFGITSNDADAQAPFPSYTATFNYVDEACQVDGDTLLYASTSSSGGGETLFNGQSLSSVGASYEGPCDGEIGFSFNSSVGFYNEATLTVRINVGGRDSNQDSDQIPFPVADFAD